MGIYKETKDRLLQVRLTESELFDIEDAVREYGYKSVSDYVRSKIFEGVK